MKRLLFTLLLTTQVALGQTDDSTATTPFPPKSRVKPGFMLESGIAHSFTTLPAIRSFFRENQIKADSRFNTLVGLGAGYRRERFKAMFHLAFGIDPEVYAAESSSFVARRQNVSNNSLSLGYDFANTRNRRVYINAGIGAIRYEYTIYRPTTQLVSFQDILTYSSPGSIPSLTLINGYWDVNVEFSQREKQSGFQLMSRIGYRRGWQTTAWASDAYQIVSGPADRISQFYAQFGIYLSVRYNKRSKR